MRTPFIVSLAFAAGLVTACGSAPAAPVRPSADAYVPARLYPLSVGRVWSYDVDTGTGMSTLAIARVTRSENGRVEVATGSEPNVYQVSNEGIRREGGAWVLKAPIRMGAEWPAANGRTARIASLDAHVESVAGNFEHCVEVIERAEGGPQIRTVYCPDVGPVLVESSMAMSLSGETVRVLATLRGTSDGSDL